MNGNQEVRVPLNYDAGKHCVMYQQNGENMILMNTQSVDSMKIAQDLFCRIKNKFYQVISYPQGKLLIDWDLDKVNVGYKEPMEQYHRCVRSLSISPLWKDKNILPTNQIPNRMFIKPETTTNIFC